MKLIFVFMLLAITAAAQPQAGMSERQLNLIPEPSTVRLQPGRLSLDSSFSVGVEGQSDARLQKAIVRFQDRLRRRTGVTLPNGVAQNPQSAKLVVNCAALGERYPKLGEDESYTLAVASDRVELKAATVLGALHGLETLLQLVSADQNGYFLPAVNIQDQPRFAWRGLMIDVGRHFEPVEVIERNIDALASVKANVFHWHLTDDQGFRIESKRYPKLHELGSDGWYYTQDEVRGVIEYAADRGVRVIPEFDMPGHTTSWMVGYPELASAPGPYLIERRFGIFDPTMDPTQEETYKFLDGFLGEMAGLFRDEFLHIGGDENNGKQWNANPKIREFMQKHGFKDTAALQSYFSQRVLKIVQKHGKRVVGWDEILSPDLPKDAVVQGWHGTQSLADAARQGHLAMWSTNYYLDHMGPAEFMYLSDPLPADSTLTPEEAKRILGGEVCAWGEYLSPEIIDGRIWPRMAAVAERFWSPRERIDVADMYRRLDRVTVGLEQDRLLHLSSTDEILRETTGTGEIGPASQLANIAQPEGVAVRQQLRIGTVFDPLVRVTDAAVPDPAFRRTFAGWVDQVLSDAPKFAAGRDSLARAFTAWRDLVPGYEALQKTAPILNDSAQRVRQLGQLGSVGLEALNYLQGGTAAPADWRERAIALVNESEKPDSSILRFAWLGSYRALVLAATQADQSKTVPVAQWKQQIYNDASRQEPVQKYTW